VPYGLKGTHQIFVDFDTGPFEVKSKGKPNGQFTLGTGAM
jgi:hypothetical protein